MASKMVQEINKELKEVLAEAVAHRDGSRIQRMLKALVRLTNSEADNAAMDADDKAVSVPVNAEKKKQLQEKIAALQAEADGIEE